MLGFKLGFGVASAFFRAFGTSAPVEALADLGASGAFLVFWGEMEGCPKPSMSVQKIHFSLRAGVPKTIVFNIQKSHFSLWPEMCFDPHEIEQPACLDTSPASWSRNPATRGQGGWGGRQTLNPKSWQLQRVTIGLYFSYAKGGLGAGHPLAEY